MQANVDSSEETFDAPNTDTQIQLAAVFGVFKQAGKPNFAVRLPRASLVNLATHMKSSVSQPNDKFFSPLIGGRIMAVVESLVRVSFRAAVTGCSWNQTFNSVR